MAAWTLPAMIMDWCEFVTTALDRRSRKYFFNIILGMIANNPFVARISTLEVRARQCTAPVPSSRGLAARSHRVRKPGSM